MIAIDFGTSRSAYSYAFVGRPDDIRVGTPSHSVKHAATQLKAETSVVLNRLEKAIGFGAVGRDTVYVENETKEVPDTLYLFQWFKMNLQMVQSDDDESVMAFDHKMRPLPLMTVISEALSYIAKSAIEEIATLGKVFSMHDVHWIITVPAIWNPAASGFMRRAAWRANMIPSQLSQRLTLVREPEGACLCMLQCVKNGELLVDIAPGSEVVVVDCGGGTNDMTFIKITSTSPMACEEIKTPSGGSHGATRIDKRLEQALERIFTPERYQRMKKSKEASVAIIDTLDNWENQKIGFAGTNNFRISLTSVVASYNSEHVDDQVTAAIFRQGVDSYNSSNRDDERIHVTGNMLQLPAALLRKWFDEVIMGIAADLHNDLQDGRCQNIRFVHLVGGFCANDYVFRQLQHLVTSQFPARQLTVFRATSPDLAIVRGAVLSRMVNFISQYVAKYSYGFLGVNKYDPDIHAPSQKFVASDGVERINEFVMFIKKGDNIQTDFETSPKRFRPLTDAAHKITLTLFILNDDHLSSSSTIYISDPRVVKFASLDIPLDRSLPLDDRMVYVSLKFGLEIQILAKDRNKVPYSTAACVYYAN